jgi:hypothetical protein
MTVKSPRIVCHSLCAVLCLGVTLLSCAFTSPSSASSSAPKGNAASIAYYTQATNRYNAQPSFTLVTYHLYWFGYTAGNRWQLSWGVSNRPASFMHAVDDTETVRLVNGKIVWEKDVFALPCAIGHVCPLSLVPLAVFQNAKHDYWTELNGPKTTPRCWYIASNAAGTEWMLQDFSSVGKQGWYAGNTNFTSNTVLQPMTTSGSAVSIKSTYVYTKSGRAATEVDIINRSSWLFTKSTVRVSKGNTPSETAYSYYSRITKPLHTPGPPVLNVCR